MTVLWCHSSMYSKRWALWVMYRMFQRDSEKIPLMGLITVVFLFRTTCWGLTGSLGFRWEGVLHPDVRSKGKKTEGFMLIQKLLLTQEKHWDERALICIAHNQTVKYTLKIMWAVKQPVYAKPDQVLQYKSNVLTTILLLLYLNIHKYPIRQSAWLDLPFSVRLNK